MTVVAASLTMVMVMPSNRDVMELVNVDGRAVWNVRASVLCRVRNRAGVWSN